MEWYGIIGILALLLILARLYRRSATACVWCAGKHPIARCRSFHAQRRWSVQSENDKGDTHRENQMPLVSPVRLQFTEKLRDHDYRTRFFAGQARDMIAMQIRKLREKRKMNQTQFAIAAKMKPSAVSRIEQADDSGWTLKTLLRAAAALDARLIVSFEPAEEVLSTYDAIEARSEGDERLQS